MSLEREVNYMSISALTEEVLRLRAELADEREAGKSKNYLTTLARVTAELAAAKVPLCIGQPIISILAKEGSWTSEDGQSVVAADGLFGADPYIELTALRAELAAEKKEAEIQFEAREADIRDIRNLGIARQKAEAELAAANEVIDRLVKTERKVADAIGDAYLLDLPDGGDVKLWEGVERIKVELAARDARLSDIASAARQAMQQGDNGGSPVAALEYIYQTARIDSALKGGDNG